MGVVVARGDVKSVTIEAVVFRNDGTSEDLGVIAQWHKNPLTRLRRELDIRRRERQRKSNESN